MTDLNVRFDEFVEKLNHMSLTICLFVVGLNELNLLWIQIMFAALKKLFRRQTRNILSDQYLKRMYVICIIILSWTVLDKE